MKKNMIEHYLPFFLRLILINKTFWILIFPSSISIQADSFAVVVVRCPVSLCIDIDQTTDEQVHQ